MNEREGDSQTVEHGSREVPEIVPVDFEIGKDEKSLRTSFTRTQTERVAPKNYRWISI